jgi:hypothetical protein
MGGAQPFGGCVVHYDAMVWIRGAMRGLQHCHSLHEVAITIGRSLAVEVLRGKFEERPRSTDLQSWQWPSVVTKHHPLGPSFAWANSPRLEQDRHQARVFDGVEFDVATCDLQVWATFVFSLTRMVSDQCCCRVLEVPKAEVAGTQLRGAQTHRAIHFACWQSAFLL